MNAIPPPKWPLRLFKWFCNPAYHSDIEGDLVELYHRRVAELGRAKAGRRLYKDVLFLFRPGIIRPIRFAHLFNSNFMLRENLRIAFRHMATQKGYAAIKIGGFAMGVAAFLLIALYIRDELSYDRQYPDLDRIYRVYIEYNLEDNIISGTSQPPPLAAAIRDEFPEVASTARFNAWPDLDGPGANQFRPADQQQNTYEEGFVYADQSLLDIFQFPLLYGDPATALSQPNTIVLTEKKARQYFQDENPLGKTVILNDRTDRPFKVTGVLADSGPQSHIRYNFYLSLAGHEFWPGEQQLWSVNFYDCYLKLKPNADAVAFEKKLQHIVREHFATVAVERGQAKSIDAFAAVCRLRLQPVDEVHLKTTSAGIRDNLKHGDIRLIWLLGIIAVFILLLAAVNFVNLSTARSANRAREVGLRKTLGSRRSTLIGQFMSESVLYSVLAFILGGLAAGLLLPQFNRMTEKSMVLPWSEPWFIPALIAASLFIGLAAGVYPAFYLSGFRPMETLKGQLSRGTKGRGLQNALVVFQFTVSIVLIAATILVNRQMNFILQKDLGFDKDQVILLQGAQTLGEKKYALRENLLQLPEVQYVSIGDFLPVEGSKRYGNMMKPENRKNADQDVLVQRWRVDPDYIKAMGMQLVEGRDFSREMPSDSLAAIVNQRLVAKMHLENPVGTYIANSDQKPVKIIGVVKDFHFESMKEEIAPLCLVLDDSYAETISVRVAPEKVSAVLPALTKIWDRFLPNQPIRYTFLDERFAAAYDDLKRMERIITGFSMLAIALACLGLFALAAFMAQQRTKEMSIRKVLGASVPTIFRLLTQNFLILVLVSLCLATPPAWYILSRWLDNYTYRVTVTADVFLLAGLAVFLIALLTISYQAIKAALVNPAEAMGGDG
ncbi:MAG TPA: ABC transporter permease [Flavilitoribacter sp.]|nr:ABC transporter permease [Flavilitoribacter sp.]HMQ86655.1 ABC transporter permease [Flavilitoribacter sp.]